MRYGRKNDPPQVRSTKSMVDIRSESRRVKVERRKDRRLDVHFDATVLGINGIPAITDISLGGFFFKGNISDRIEVGQIKAFNVKLPSEKYLTRFKAKVMRKTYRGMGCQLTNRNGREWTTLYKFFKFYNFFNDINPESFD